VDWITAAQATERLGVKRRTLYTYASRGWIGTRALDGRRKLYRSADVERLRDRANAQRSHAVRAAQALSWGQPVLSTQVSGIDRDGPYYRGVCALDLVDEPLERVAERLWGCGEQLWPPRTLADRTTDLHTLRRWVDRLDRAHDPLVQAVRLVSAVRDWCGLPEHADLTAAQVLCADHGLNPSTFTARVVASTGADLTTCVVGALASFSGPAHGNASVQLGRALDGQSVAGDPGFGHPLYPDGDPRAEALLSRFDLAQPVFDGLRAQIESRAGAGVHPNVDAGLAALCLAHGLPWSAGPRIFLVGRLCGWIAHALEQRETPGLLRPRGHFAGWVEEPPR
jgi:citrate synthase